MPGYFVPFITRREPVTPIIGSAVRVAGKFGEEIAYNPVDDPVKRSAFNTRPAKMFLAAFVNPFERFISDDQMLGRKYHDRVQATVPDGRQRAWRERSNITRPAPETYGSRFEV